MLILDVTLLNYEEFKKYEKYIQILPEAWWLKTKKSEGFF